MADKKITIVIKDINDNLQKLNDFVDFMYPGRPDDIEKKNWPQLYYLDDIKKRYKRILKETDLKTAMTNSDAKPDLQVE